MYAFPAHQIWNIIIVELLWNFCCLLKTAAVEGFLLHLVYAKEYLSLDAFTYLKISLPLLCNIFPHFHFILLSENIEKIITGITPALLP